MDTAEARRRADCLEGFGSQGDVLRASATIRRLCNDLDHLRALLARALDHIDPNDDHEDYLLLLECEKAVGP